MPLDENGVDEDENYDEAFAELSAEWKKGKKGNQVVIKRLMATTATRRRNWITSERPLICDVLKKFPALSNTRMVSLNTAYPDLLPH